MPQFSPTKSILEEQLRKVESASAKLPWRIFSFSFIVFIALISLYFGIVFGYKPYLNSRIKKLDQKINDLTQSINEEQQNNLINFYSQITNTQNIIKSHIITSKLFDLLEKNTYPDIHYIVLDLEIKRREAKIEGIAANYEVLVKEMELLRRLPETEKILLESSQWEDISKEMKGVKFTLRIILTSQFFKE